MGLALGRHRRERVCAAAGPAERQRVRELIAGGDGGPLAPFALRPEKHYVFAPDGRAAIGYAVRMRTALVGGDPVGERASWTAAIEAFIEHAHGRGLRIGVLGAGEHARTLWAHHRLRAMAIGRDVVIDPTRMDLTGRRYRNLRQAVQRSHNAGVSVEFYREGELSEVMVCELRDLMRVTHRSDTRGFSMILGRLFDGTQPDALIAVARDRTGLLVGAHRYLWSGERDLSFDIPVRSWGAPNGVDERLICEVVRWSAGHGVRRVSLAFAPFPDLFANRRRLGLPGQVAYHAVHLLDPLIKVERLYNYLRKFHAFGQQRYVMLRWRQVVPVAVAALLLEFF